MRTIVAADMFAGAGGASEGLYQACAELGIDLKLYAINHWKEAIELHKRNHPDAIHTCANVTSINPTKFIKEGRLDVLIAAPECIFFSQARGGKPIDDQRRSTAWSVVDWAEALGPTQILIENVPELRRWGPLLKCEHYSERSDRCKKHGKKCFHNKPDRAKAGAIYQQYLAAFRALGYTVQERLLCAADYGGATTRKRLFIQCSKGTPIEWPNITHAQEPNGDLERWRAAREVIDWSLKGESIFNRKRPLASATMRRIIAGLERYGGPELQPYLVVLRNNMDGKPLSQPVPTIAAAGQHLGVAHPVIVPTTHGSDTSKRERSVNQPLPTLTGANRGELALAEAFVLSQASGGAPRPVSEPVPAICTDGAHQLVEGVLVEYHSDNREGEKPRARSLDGPLPTQTTENRFGIAQPVIVPHRTWGEGAVDSVERPLRTITAAAGHNFGLASGALVPFYGERPGQEPRAHSVDEPMPVIPATGDGKFGIAEGVLTSFYGTLNVSSVDKPLRTVTTKDRFGLVQPVINGYALDIRFRMLQPHELAAAMDFPVNYFPAPRQGRKGKGFTKGAIVKMIGNAWDVKQGAALCRSILKVRFGLTGRPSKKVA